MPDKIYAVGQRPRLGVAGLLADLQLIDFFEGPPTGGLFESNFLEVGSFCAPRLEAELSEGLGDVFAGLESATFTGGPSFVVCSRSKAEPGVARSSSSPKGPGRWR